MNGSLPLAYQWFRNGTPLAGGTRPALLRAPLTTVDAGSYTVVATNAAGSATSNAAVLTVQTPPVITTQPVSQSELVGATATFTSAASGTPAPTFQWQKGGVTIPGKPQPTTETPFSYK